MKDEHSRTKLGMSRYIIIFVVLYIVFAVMLNKIFTIIMLMVDGVGFSFADAVRASGDMNVNPIIGMVLAIPLALVITAIVRAVIKAIDRKKNRENSIENQHSRKINEQIMKDNTSVDISNSNVMEQIAACEQMQEQLVQKLRDTAAWYPEVYFTLMEVNYIIEQMETGKADSVNQAIVHYEAGQM